MEINRVGITNIIHMLLISAFQAKSFPSQQKILKTGLKRQERVNLEYFLCRNEKNLRKTYRTDLKFPNYREEKNTKE
jgi:hypothetical protein